MSIVLVTFIANIIVVVSVAFVFMCETYKEKCLPLSLQLPLCFENTQSEVVGL